MSGSNVLYISNMVNIEHQPGEVGRRESLRQRRDEVGVAEALLAQKKVLEMMIPEEISAHLSTDENDPLMDDVAMHWMNKYAIGEFNGFTKYCNEVASDGFVERASRQAMNQGDYDALISFLTTAPVGRPFFTNEELNAFLETHGFEQPPTIH